MAESSSKGSESSTSLAQQLGYLRKLTFFHDFDDDELRQFLAVSKWCRVQKGEVVIREGTTERVFYLLVRGKAEVIKHGKNNNPTLLTTLQTGTCFGEMALVGETKRTADVVAKTESFLIRVEPEILEGSNVFLQLKFYRRFCETLVTRLDLANRRMVGQEPSVDKAMRRSLNVPEDSSVKRLVSGSTVKQAPKLKPSSVPPPPPLEKEKLQLAQIRQMIRPDQIRAVNPVVKKELHTLLRGDLADGDIRRIAELILYDPVISVWVLMLANSVAFRRGAQVSTIPHAMVIVGIKQMAEFVGNILDESEHAVLFSGFDEMSRRFWFHSVMVGKVAKMLQEASRISSESDLYLCGLLHDLGTLALDQVSPRFYPQLLRPEVNYTDICREERQYIGVDHGWAGAWLGKYFALSPAVVEVMRNHHNLTRVANHQEVVAMIGLADLFVREREDPELAALDDPEHIYRSFGWVLLQEQHRPFMEVNVVSFVDSFREELEKNWNKMQASIPV